MREAREIGICVYGATGYTGRLVAEYLNRRYGVGGAVKWAMAGRSIEKLQQVRDELGISPDVPLVVADAAAAATVKDLAKRCSVVLTTVGPYTLYGSGLVAACAAAGTDYVDLCGEPAWMHEMINTYEKAAQKSGARIVFSCGFDSIPFDLGVYFLQITAERRSGKPITRVKGRVRSMKGTWSGGTLASFRASMAAVAKNPELLAVLKNPFALTPGFAGTEQPKGNKPEFDAALNSWAAPFVMASINTKNVHRSNLLLGHPYGKNFAYDEMILTGPGEKGEQVANAIANDKSMANDTTKPGEGPSREEREAGSYDVLFIGETDDGDFVKVSVKGDMDPGYGSTSKMIAEAAVCLLQNPTLAEGGIWTPAAAMGSLLIERLQENAGLTFTVE